MVNPKVDKTLNYSRIYNSYLNVELNLVFYNLSKLVLRGCTNTHLKCCLEPNQEDEYSHIIYYCKLGCCFIQLNL